MQYSSWFLFLFFCYKLYWTPKELLDSIILLWDRKPPENDNIENFEAKNKSAIMLFLSGWFESQYDEDFIKDTRELLISFIEQLPIEYKKPLQSKIANVKKKVEPSLFLFKTSKKKVKILSGNMIDILHIKPSRIAEQWTLIDLRNFMSIKKGEFLKLGTHWERMIKRSVMFTRWVASEIVEKKKRSKET